MTPQSRLERQLVVAVTAPKPQVPEAGRTLWRIFVALSAARTYHMAGPNPIAYAEIDAYGRLLRWPLAPHHIDILRAMDNAWLEHIHGKAGDGRERMLPGGSEKPINPNAFDAVFG